MNITTSLLLSAATFPLLVSLDLLKRGSQQLTELGELSEEIFRGDRLPLLPFPKPDTTPEDLEA